MGHKWSYGRVSRQVSHFKIVYGDFLGEEDLITVAVMGKTERHNEFIVELLRIPNKKAHENLEYELNLYLTEKKEPKTFGYMCCFVNYPAIFFLIF